MCIRDRGIADSVPPAGRREIRGDRPELCVSSDPSAAAGGRRGGGALFCRTRFRGRTGRIAAHSEAVSYTHLLSGLYQQGSGAAADLGAELRHSGVCLRHLGSGGGHHDPDRSLSGRRGGCAAARIGQHNRDQAKRQRACEKRMRKVRAPQSGIAANGSRRRLQGECNREIPPRRGRGKGGKAR